MSGWDAAVGAVIGGAAAIGGGAFVGWRDRLRVHRVEVFDVHLPALADHWPEIISERQERTAPFDAARRCVAIASAGDRRRFESVSRAVRLGRRAERHANAVGEELGGREDPEAMEEPIEELNAAREAFDRARDDYSTWLEQRLSLSGAVGYRRWRWRYKRIVGNAPEDDR